MNGYAVKKLHSQVVKTIKLTARFVIDQRNSFRIRWLGTTGSLSKKNTMLTFSPDSYERIVFISFEKEFRLPLGRKARLHLHGFSIPRY